MAVASVAESTSSGPEVAPSAWRFFKVPHTWGAGATLPVLTGDSDTGAGEPVVEGEAAPWGEGSARRITADLLLPCLAEQRATEREVEERTCILDRLKQRRKIEEGECRIEDGVVGSVGGRLYTQIVRS